jgi:hypothetical protein
MSLTQHTPHTTATTQTKANVSYLNNKISVCDNFCVFTAQTHKINKEWEGNVCRSIHMPHLQNYCREFDESLFFLSVSVKVQTKYYQIFKNNST